jgi:hypothetical protein
VWPQYWDLYEPRGPAKGPNGGKVPPHQNKKKVEENGHHGFGGQLRKVGGYNEASGSP